MEKSLQVMSVGDGRLDSPRLITWRFFSLIELLVVIAVIAMLASMLLPALAKARQKAVDIKGLSNRKQIALGVSLYANDFDGWTPYNYTHGYRLYSESLASYSGFGRLYEEQYIDSGEMLWCVDEAKQRKQNGIRHSTYGLKRLDAPTSNIQTTIMNRNGRFTQNGGTIIRTNNPSDRLGEIEEPDTGMAACASANPGGSTAYMTWRDLHDGRGTNISFVDGSATWFAYNYWFPSGIAPDPFNRQWDEYGNRYRLDMNYWTVMNLARRSKGVAPRIW